MINYAFFFSTFFVVLAAGQFLAFRFRKHRMWDYTDYLWYGLAAASLFFFVADANVAAQARQSEQRIDQLKTDFDHALKSYVEEARKHSEDSRLNAFSYGQLLEFRQSPSFPLDEYVELNGTRHEDVFAFLQTFEVPGTLTDMPNALPNQFFDVGQMEQSRSVISELRSSSNGPKALNPSLLYFAAYLLAFGVAVRLGKVTAVILRA